MMLLNGLYYTDKVKGCKEFNFLEFTYF